MSDISEQDDLPYTNSDNESDQDRFVIPAFRTNRVPLGRSIHETNQLLSEQVWFNPLARRHAERARGQLNRYTRIRDQYEADIRLAQRRINNNRGTTRARRRRAAINARDLREAQCGHSELTNRINELREEIEDLEYIWKTPGFEDSD